MAIKYSVGVSSTPRDRSLLERRRASSSRVAGGRSGSAPAERAARARASSEQGAGRGRGWLLMSDAANDELDDSQAFWAW
jgi:hypothetical protein